MAAARVKKCIRRWPSPPPADRIIVAALRAVILGLLVASVYWVFRKALPIVCTLLNMVTGYSSTELVIYIKNIN